MDNLNESLTEYKKIKLNSKSLQSYEKYLQRLKTFELFKWFAKPTDFSPVQCAKHGWMNLSKDTLKCVVCSSLFYFYSSSSLNRSVFESERVQQSKESLHDPRLLIEKHSQHCPWRTLEVSDHLIQVNICDKEKAIAAFMTTHASLAKCKQMPIISDDLLKDFEEFSANNSFKLTIAQQSIANWTTMGALTGSKRGILIANCGWSYNEEKDILECENCTRSIGLWMYKRSQAVVETEDTNEQSMSEEEDDDDDDSTFANTSLFGNVESYVDDLVVAQVLNKIVDSVEIEEQTSLKNGNEINQMARNSLESGGQVSTIMINNSNSKRKRKLSDATRGLSTADNDYISSIEDRKKLFDPLSEHFNWCPRLRCLADDSEQQQLPVDKLRYNTCHASYAIVVQNLSSSSSKSTDKKSAANESDRSTRSADDNYFKKVKYVHSLLADCTSHLLNK